MVIVVTVTMMIIVEMIESLFQSQVILWCNPQYRLASLAASEVSKQIVVVLEYLKESVPCSLAQKSLTVHHIREHLVRSGEMLHCCYTVVTLLLHCCYRVVTLLLHCCYTVVAPCSWR
jgi:hypothetical protein